MNRDNIISIVRQAGFRVGDQFHNACDEEAAIRLFGVAAAFGAAQEREACAKVCDDRMSGAPAAYASEASLCAAYIRARGQA